MFSPQRINYIANARGLYPVPQILYRIYPGKHIVFTGIQNRRAHATGSTINCAEVIVRTIARKEGIQPWLYTFYDLQTYLGYNSHPVGYYTLNRLQITWDGQYIERINWHEGYGSQKIFDDFGRCINGGNIGLPYLNLAEVRGTLKPLGEEEPLFMQDWLDLAVLIGEVWGDKHPLRDEYLERSAKVATLLCEHNGLDTEQFETVSRDAPLGPQATAAFNSLCDWLTEQDQTLTEYIHTPLFFD